MFEKKNLWEIIHNFSRTAIFDEYEIYTFNQYMAIKDKQKIVYVEFFFFKSGLFFKK